MIFRRKVMVMTKKSWGVGGDWCRVSKNAIFGPNSLPGFWTQRISLMIPIRPGFGTNQ